MRHRLADAICSLCLLAVVGCANPADDKPAAVVNEAPVAGESATPSGGQRFVIAPEASSIGFVGSKITRSHTGGFKTFSGEIQLVDGDPTRSSVRIDIDAASLFVDNADLTEHLKSPDFFDVARFPKARFESTAIAKDAAGYSITGNLAMHGVTKSITFPATIEAGTDQVGANAEFSIKRFDFGIVYPGKADDLIRDEVVIKLQVVAKPA